MDKFDAANPFGLSDMHGNVWEWCLVPWHETYHSAPSDNSVWDDNNQQEDYYNNIVKNIQQLLTDKRNHEVRGGSYLSEPRNCRSVSRYGLTDFARDDLGFRVMCVLPRE